jgi:hypothetical protein
MDWKAEIRKFEEGERNGMFIVALMGQIRNGYDVIYTETTNFEIDLTVLEQTFGDKESFVQHSTTTLQKNLELLIEQKFKILEYAF